MKKTKRPPFKIILGLISLMGSFFYIILLAVINGTLGNLSAIGVVVFGSFAVGKALGADISLSYGLIIALTVSCGLLRGLLRYFEQYSNHYIAFKLLAILRDKVFSSLRRLCPAKLETKKKGSIIALITADIETLEVFYAHTMSPVMIAIFVSTTMFLFIGFYVCFYLALVALIGYLVIGVILPLISSKILRQSGIDYRNEFSSFNAYFLDSIKGIKDIVLNNGQKEREKEVDRRSTTLLDVSKRTKLKSGRMAAITELIVSVFILLGLLCGILLVNNNIISIGKCVIGLTAIFSSFGPVIALSSLPSNLTQTFASGDRVLDLLEEKPLVEDIKEKDTIDSFHNLNVSSLSFGYTEETPVLKDISLQMKQGEIIGIIGRSGCGKSTLLKLLLRFFKSNESSINYNGLDIDSIDTDSLLRNVTMVSQTTYLFDDTIENNLRIANPDATMEDIREACKKASIDSFIMSLPDGYDTKVSSALDNLSAGEKQRIGLARAFLRGSGLILLDEPTSNVDSINEGIILKALKDQKKDKGIILVSHRESTTAICDHVYRIEEGKITFVR